MFYISNCRARRARRAAAWGPALAVVALLGAGCVPGASSEAEAAKSNELRLSGPNINILVDIPSGWHQVINSGSPVIPEMVSPISCMGSAEVSCALGLARTISVTAPTADAAEKAIYDAVAGTQGVTMGQSTSKGPAKVGRRDGFVHRFTFSNPGAKLTAAIAAVQSGPVAPNPQGEQEYSIILVWVSDNPEAPKPEVIDEILGSALVAGGVPPK